MRGNFKYVSKHQPLLHGSAVPPGRFEDDTAPYKCVSLSLILMKLQLSSICGANGERRYIRLKKTALLLAIVSFCLFGYVLNSKSEMFCEFQAALLLVEWMLLVCLAVWCGTFVFLTFSRKDLPLIAMLFAAIAAFFVSHVAARPAMEAIILLVGATLGRGAQFLLNAECGTRSAEDKPELRTQNSELRIFLVGLILLLALASWWHLDARPHAGHSVAVCGACRWCA